MKTSILALLLLAGGAAPVLAQQQPQFTHYGFNGMYLNPAYAGIKGQGEINVIGRYQYYNLGNTRGDANGSPRTGLLTASLPIPALSGGVGLTISYDQAGEVKVTNSTLSYSQHIKLGAGKLGIGVQGTYTYLSAGTFVAIDPTDPYIPYNGSDRKFDAGAGIWYESPKFYAGLSANNLFRTKYTLQAAVLDPVSGKVIGYQNTSEYLNENHAYFTAGYNIEASSSVVVTPTVLAKVVLPGSFNSGGKFSNSKNYSFEGGIRATLDDKYWIGANYRQQESVSGLVGVSFAKDNAVRLGLAYDFIAFNQDARATSSYEILLSYRLPKPGLLIRPAIRTPRYSF